MLFSIPVVQEHINQHFWSIAVRRGAHEFAADRASVDSPRTQRHARFWERDGSGEPRTGALK